ncbi:terminase small subunit [Luteolibacter flavescens]|uniref:Terminase small subunit n=1 Tax=Luteolibacter flavescens TaxID=1859460 RepID=A0ABT3FQQ8_9BACT|nr:terminase small subunit [Luteolibacter flavescens]MCW1885529.1 terminase small subunit [Luteolibacter flavescens]
MKSAKKKATKPEPKPNVRRERFCEFIAAGVVPADAWIQAGYKVSREVARRNAHEALSNPDVQAKIAALREPQTKAAHMTKDEKLRFLAELIRTPIEQIGPDSPLCVEFSEETVAGGSRGKLRRGQAPSGNEVAGPTVLRRKVKMGDKLRAIELHSKLLGHFEPDRVEVDVGEKTLLSIKERASQVTSALAGKYKGGKKG